jgi:hypothetical protein
MTADGVRVTDTEGNVLMEQPVEEKRHFQNVSGQRRSHSRLGKTS